MKLFYWPMQYTYTYTGTHTVSSITNQIMLVKPAQVMSLPNNFVEGRV